MTKPTLMTVKEVREKLVLESNPGVHYLVEQGKLKVKETLSDGTRLFDAAEVERCKRERIKELREKMKDLVKRVDALRST